MSYFVWFDFSVGLKTSITVPAGWTERTLAYVENLEETLGIEREKYLDNPAHWKHTRYEGIPDKVLCEMAESHNDWVRRVYGNFDDWSKTPPVHGETLTPEQAEEFWPALEMITVPPQRWTRDYYINRMEHLFDVMTRGESEGVSLGAKKLTPKQAGEIINLFSIYLDNDDTRLAVVNGYLTKEYDWCEKCYKAIGYEDDSCRRRKCPLQVERNEGYEE